MARGRSSHHSTVHHSHIGAHRSPISHTTHHYHHSSGGRAARVRILSPAEIEYNKKMDELAVSIQPPTQLTTMFRVAGFLQFITFPLFLATIATPWYIVDGTSATEWDGTVNSSPERQAGYLTLSDYKDCTWWSNEVDWQFCDLYTYSISASTADPTLKSASTFGLAVVIICILSNFSILFRHGWTCGNRLFRKGDEWYIKWAKITRTQLFIHAVLILIAETFYRQNVPLVIDDVVGAGDHRFGPGIDVAIAALILSALSAFLYSNYIRRIAVHAETHPIPELPTSPPPVTQQEAAMQWANQMAQQMGQQYAVGMMQAQQQAMNGGIPMQPNPDGTMPPNTGGNPPMMPMPGMPFPPNMMMPGMFPMNMMMPGMMGQPAPMMPQPPNNTTGQPPNMMMPPYNMMYPTGGPNPYPNDPNVPMMPMGGVPTYPYYQNPNIPNNGMPMSQPPATMPYNGMGYPSTQMSNTYNYPPPTNSNEDEPSADVEKSSKNLNTSMYPPGPSMMTTTNITINNNGSAGNLNDNPNESSVSSPTVVVTTTESENPPPSAPTMY